MPLILSFTEDYPLFRLNNLYSGLPDDNSLRYDVYLSQVKIAARFGHTSAIQTQLKEVSELQYSSWHGAGKRNPQVFQGLQAFWTLVYSRGSYA